jgi:hypothetical protein
MVSCPEFMWYVLQTYLRHARLKLLTAVSKKTTIAVCSVTPCSPVDDTNTSQEKFVLKEPKKNKNCLTHNMTFRYIFFAEI